MPKKPNVFPQFENEIDVKHWLLEQQKQLDALKERKKETTSNAVEPNPWQHMNFIRKPDPPMRRFPTRSGELWYGGVPTYQTLAKLRDMDVYLIWNLAAEFDVFVSHEKAYVPHVLHANIEDYDVPANNSKFLRQANEVVSVLKAGKKVFVHCYFGHGRSGMAIAALDVIMNGHGAKQALSLARAATSGPETPSQVAFVKALAKHLKTSDSIEDEFAEDIKAKPVNPEQGKLNDILDRYVSPKETTLVPSDRAGYKAHTETLKQNLKRMQDQRDKERLELERQDEARVAKRYKEQQEAKKKPRPT